jgi:hypothetical protein
MSGDGEGAGHAGADVDRRFDEAGRRIAVPANRTSIALVGSTPKGATLVVIQQTLLRFLKTAPGSWLDASDYVIRNALRNAAVSVIAVMMTWLVLPCHAWSHESADQGERGCPLGRARGGSGWVQRTKDPSQCAWRSPRARLPEPR